MGDYNSKVDLERYRNLFENISSGVAVYETVDNGKDFVFKDCNKACKKIDNIKRKDIIGKRLTEVFPSVKEFGLLDVFQRVYKTGKSESHPITLYRDNRLEGWRKNFVYKLSTNEIVAVYDDITEKKRIEIESINLTRKLKKSQNIAHIGNWEWDIDTNNLWWSDELYNVFGVKKGVFNLSFENIVNHIHPEDRDKNQKMVDELKKKGKTRKIEFRIIQPSGKIKWVKQIIEVDDKSNKSKIARGIIQDVTDIKKTEIQLKESNEQLDAIVNSSYDLITIYDLEKNKLLWSNSRWRELLGWSPKKIKDPLKYIHPDDKDKVVNALSNIFNGSKKEIRNLEYRYKTNKGKYRFFTANILKIKIDGKDVLFTDAHDITKQKKAEEDLKESGRKYRDLVENIQEGIWQIDKEGYTVFVNKKMADMFGYRVNEMMGKHLFDFMNKKWIKVAKEKLKERGQGLKEGHEFEFIKKNGDVLYCYLNTTPLKENNEYAGALASIIDMAEKKKAEEELKISEENYKTIFNSSSDAIFVHNINDFSIVDVNQEACKRYGYTKEEFNKLKVDEISDSSYSIKTPEFQKLIKKVAKGEKITVEWLSKKKDETLFWQEVTGKVINLNEKPHFLAITKDIDERKKADEEIKKREAIFSTIVETAPSLLLITDKNGNNTYISTNVKEYTGYSQKDFIGTVNWWIHPDDFEKVKYNFDKTFTEHISGKNFEYKAIKKNGEIWYASSSWKPLKDAEGNFNGIVMQTIDITEKKKREQELKKGLMKYNLRQGYLYLEFEKTPTKTITAFKDMIKTGYAGIIFSRTPQKQFKDEVKNNANYFWISDRKEKNSIRTEEIVKSIEKQNEKKVIFIDRFDYIISKLGFKRALGLIQSIKEISYIKNHTIMISLDEGTISNIEKIKIQKETSEIEPRLKAPIDEDLKEIIDYVYGKNLNGFKPNYNEIGEKLDMSKPTTRNRIRRLIKNGYLSERTKGRKKILEITDKTRNIFT